MADFLSGFIGKGIDIAVDQILHHANIALRCREELNSLRDLVTSIKPIAAQIHQYRLQLNRERGTSIVQSRNNASQWVQKLHGLLQQALPIVQQCTIPSINVYARYRMSRNISNLISEIKKHLELVALVRFEQQSQMHMEMRKEIAQASSSTYAFTSQASTGSFFVKETLTVEKLVIDDAEVNYLFGIGVVGNDGSENTLLLKTVFNTQKVRAPFRDDLSLRLTVSESPFPSLINVFCEQIAAVQIKENNDQNMNEEDVKRLLIQRMQSKRFVLFLDHVWGKDGQFPELGLSRLTQHSNSKIIVTSRNLRALPEISTFTIEDLSEDKSWELFARPVFPCNNGKPLANTNQRRAKLECDKCEGLPLAIKVIGRAMASIIDAQEWELEIHRLPKANSQDHQSLHDRVRWSYDALASYDVNIQLCFLYLAAFTEYKIIEVEQELITFWVGEVLLERNEPELEKGCLKRMSAATTHLRWEEFISIF